MTPLLALALTAQFTAPESALFHDGVLYVSDIGQFERNGDGRIFSVTDSGWAPFTVGLNDPKGLATSRGWLFVADVDRVWKIDTAGVASLHAGPNAFPSPPSFLNGMCSDATGYLYVSDTFGGAVYRVTTKGVVSKVADMTLPNGLAVVGGKLYAASFSSPGAVYCLNGGEAVKVYESEDIAGADGLAYDGNGTLYVSGFKSGRVVALDIESWKGRVVAKGLKTPAGIYVSGRTLYIPLLEEGKLQTVEVE